MKISAQKVIQVEAKTLHLHLKVCDEFYATLEDVEGATLKDYEGYVPSMMPGEHYGDYVILDIDIDTGMITNWKAPTAERVESFISAGEN